jgi:RHS repeat-associated protein
MEPSIYLHFSAGNNRADEGNYDYAGNPSTDGANNYLYDAENRICAVQQIVAGGVIGYLYAPNGTRLGKNENLTSFSCDMTKNGMLTANGIALTTAYDSGLQGEQLEVTDGQFNLQQYNIMWQGKLLGTFQGATYAQSDWHFAVNDWLGTKRVITNSDGSYSTSFYSGPFGDFQTQFGAGSDPSDQHFTSKERDQESGNDYFGARYYASNLGRFLSPDPSALAYADPTNPQSFNLYSYVLNNPLTNIDPTGLDCVQDNGDGTVTTNAGDCGNESEAAANAQHYIDCDGCTSGAAGANLDAATGSLYLTDANGNGISGTTVSDFADPQGTPATDVTVNGSAPYLDTISGFGTLPDIDSQRLQQLATGITLDSQHSFGCIANAYGLGAPGETARYLGQPVANTKRFITPGTSIGTSPLSDLARGLPRVSGSFRAPVGGPGTGRAFQMARTGSLGVAAARYAPFVGLAADAVSVGQLYNCLGH